MRLLRCRIRDITSFHNGTCVCGRTHVRMARVTGRTDDMLIIRGVNVFPSQIESILMEIEGTEPHYQLVIDRKGTLDEVEVQVEVSPQVFTDEVKGLEELQERVREEI